MKTMVATLAMMLLASLPVTAEINSVFDDGDEIVGATYVDGEYKTASEGDVYIDVADAVWGNTSRLILVYHAQADDGWRPVSVVIEKPSEGWSSVDDSRRFDIDNGITMRNVWVYREFDPSVAADDQSVSGVKGRY